MKKDLTLANGIRGALVNDACALYAGLAISVRAGSRYELPAQHGLTHFLEHLLFHKTENYRTFEELAIALDRVMVDFDATTHVGAMTLSFEIPRSMVHNAIDLAAEIVLHPYFTRDALEQEATRIADEEHLDDDIVEPTVDDLIEALIFRGNGLAKSVSGMPDQLTNITVKELDEWHRTVIRANRMAFAMSGNFDLALAEKQLRQRFGRVGKGPPPLTDGFVINQERPRLMMVDRPTRLLQVRVGFPTFGFDHPDRLILTVLNNHVGGMERRSSRLSVRLIGGGLTYSVWSQVWHYSEAGRFQIDLPVHPTNLLKALAIVREELNEIRTTLLSRNQLNRAQVSLKRAARDRKYTPLVQAGFFAQQLLMTGAILTSDQFIYEINRTRSRDVRRVAQAMLVPNRMNVVVMGPIAGIDRRDICDALGITEEENGGDSHAEASATV